MQRSSASIGSLAAALAKAQRELTNPDKSLVATIPAGGPGATEKTFRYASLSNGLDIVRKTLGQHEIATVQTTSLDQSAGIINLTTVLAHSSGEWIASDWPVCAISETAAPHRMGAALTYARRYALFTLVGIAGEDDLDAPDVTTPANPVAVPEKPAGNNNGHLNGSKRFPAQRAPLRHPGGQPSSPSSLRRVLAPDEALELRTRLIAELDELDTVDGATLWARRSLAGKNRLNTADAQLVEDSFRAKLESLAAAGVESHASAAHLAAASGPDTNSPQVRTRSEPIDKSALGLSEPRRVRDRDHVRFVARQPCLVCDRLPSDAHHIRFAQSRALGRKVSDEFTVPLCRGHHREVHRSGNEADWWRSAGIDPMIAARRLWLEKHPLPDGKTGPYKDVTAPAATAGSQSKARRDRRPATPSSSGKTNRSLRTP
jgi:hypothetical protein